jgi:hypothetical protein
MLAQPGEAENDLISVRGKRQTDIHEYELDLIDPLSPILFYLKRPPNSSVVARARLLLHILLCSY